MNASTSTHGSENSLRKYQRLCTLKLRCIRHTLTQNSTAAAAARSTESSIGAE